MDERAARAKVRQLLLSADNIIKNRTEPERFGRARVRLREAREVASAAGLTDVLPFIERRLDGLETSDGT
jgi:hypothetical protein